MAGAKVVRLSSKGQIVIPASVRRKLGLKPGHSLALRAVNGKDIVFSPLEQDARETDLMLQRARAWARKARRDLVEELHERRRRERERDARRRRD